MQLNPIFQLTTPDADMTTDDEGGNDDDDDDLRLQEEGEDEDVDKRGNLRVLKTFLIISDKDKKKCFSSFGL